MPGTVWGVFGHVTSHLHNSSTFYGWETEVQRWCPRTRREEIPEWEYEATCLWLWSLRDFLCPTQDMFPEATFPWFSVLSRAHCTSSHFPSKIAGHHALLHHVTCDLTMVQNVWNQAFLGNSLMKDHYKQRASTTHLPEHVTFLPDVWPGAKSSKLFPIY